MTGVPDNNGRRVSYREQRQLSRHREGQDDFESMQLGPKGDSSDFSGRCSSARGCVRSELGSTERRSSQSSDEEERHAAGRHGSERFQSDKARHQPSRNQMRDSGFSSATTKPRDKASRDAQLESDILLASGDEDVSKQPRRLGVKEFDRAGPHRERVPPSLDVVRTQSNQDGHDEQRKAKAKQSNDEKPERAVKYTFNHETEEWEGQRVYISLSERPFAQGGCRVCYKMTELRPNGSRTVCVAKMYKIATPPETYFDEAMTQMLAEDYAKEFNRLGLKRSIAFLPVSVFKLSERGGQLVNVEPMLEGKYVKHNDNDGHVDTDDMVPQAFSHFSWEKSRRKLLICDIQGVGDFYTDPQIHSEDGEGFGTGNMGMEGVTRFFETHKCNLVCKALQLRNCKFPAGSSQCDRAASAADVFGRSLSRASSTYMSEADSEEDSWTGSRSAPGRGNLKDKSALKSRLWNTGRNYGKALLKAVKSTLAPAAAAAERERDTPSPVGRSPVACDRPMRVSSCAAEPGPAKKTPSQPAKQPAPPPQAETSSAENRRRRASVA